jgi:DNA (cytosine-5)-methyltransferase 1
VAEARRPAYLLLENVPGLLNHEQGETFRTILSAIHELGYSLEWCVLNSANFGVPQQRKRVYIVGYLDSRLSGKIFPLPTGDGATPKQIIPGGQGQRVYSTDGASVCLTSQGGGWGAKTGLYFVDMNADPKVTHEARCITARQDAGVSNHRGEHSGVIITGSKIVETPDSKMVLTATDKNGIEYCGRVRRLTPHECFRLQGFTDEQFEKVLWAGIPEAQLYKMAGNSVTTNVVTAVAKKLMEEIKKLEVTNA